jgi:hypothetical protein
MKNESEQVTATASRRRVPAPRPASTKNGQRSRDRVLQAAVDLLTEAGSDQAPADPAAASAGPAAAPAD